MRLMTLLVFANEAIGGCCFSYREVFELGSKDTMMKNMKEASKSAIAFCSFFMMKTLKPFVDDDLGGWPGLLGLIRRSYGQTEKSIKSRFHESCIVHFFRC